MTDGAAPAGASGMDEPASQRPASEPPPLDAIRIKGPSPRGLNKPAILAAAGCAVAIVLVLASGAFSPGPSRKPAETKPMMSAPARPEMANGAIRTLPADYTQTSARPPDRASGEPPLLGPPLPGDVAAFAEPDPVLRGRTHLPAHGWAADEWEVHAAPGTADDEAGQAARSGLFFALRNEPAQARTALVHDRDSSPADQVASAPQRDPALPQDAAGRSLFPGTVIPASLMTGLNSEAPGPVIAQVTQSIYDSLTGRNLLIPQGARLIGEYKSSTRYGQSRVVIIWQRLIMPDGAERMLGEPAVSPDGAAGLSGEVDNHWGGVFGAAILGTLINVGVAATEDPELTFSGIGAVSRDPVDRAIQDGVQRAATSVTARIVDRSLAIPPTIRVGAGARISVIVTRRSAF